MTAVQKRLASYVLSEHFGDIVETIGSYLIRKGSRSLRDIKQETKHKAEQVQKGLCTLIQHRLVTFELNNKNITVYKVTLDNILIFARFPRFIYCAKTLFGKVGELLVEETLKHGALQMTVAIKAVADRTKDNGTASSESEVKNHFAKLVDGHFLKRLPSFNQAITEDEKIEEEEMQFVLPPEGANVGTKRKRSTDDSGHSAKRQKIQNGIADEESEVAHDDGILWHVNFSRFHQQFVDEAIVLAIEKKFDSIAAQIAKAMLRMDEQLRDPLAPTSDRITLYEIINKLPSECAVDHTRVSQYLGLMVDDQDQIIKKEDERGGGTYVINIKKSLATLCQHTIQSIIQERFGSSALRIFRLLLKKKHLEQKQIGEMAMIPSKDTKELIYKLFAEKFITLQEVPRASDYAPSRTFYLFSADLKQLSRMLLERTYQTLGNLKCRRQYEVEEHKRLLDKQEKLDSMIAGLKADHGEEGAADDVSELEDMITPAEKEILVKLKAKRLKLEHSEIQVDETAFILSQYIAIH